MIHKNINLNINQIINLLDYNYFSNNTSPLTDFQKSVLDKLPNIIQKFSHDDFKKVIYTILSKTLYIKKKIFDDVDLCYFL